MFSANEIVTQNTELASPPDIFLKISHALDDPSRNANDIAKIIDNDPGLTARILRIVNSAFYSFSANITSISHAVSILGAKELRNLVLTTVVVDRFSSLPNTIMSMKEYWALSVRTALYAKILGSELPNDKKMDSLFICGLLHGTGLLIVYSKLPELARAAILKSGAESITESEAQKALIGFDFAEAGAELAKQWQLPDVIQETTRFQNSPEKASSFPVETAIISVSREMSLKTNHEELQTRDEVEKQENGRWDLIGLKPEILSDVTPEVENLFTETYSMIYQS